MMELISNTLLDDYYLYREEKKHPLSLNTKKQIQFTVNALNDFINNKYPSILLKDLRQFHIEKFISYLLHDIKLKESSISGRLIYLRGFFSFCLQKDLIEKDPLLSIDTPDIPLNKKICIQQNEWEQILKAVSSSDKNGNDFHRVMRDLALLQIIAYTACTLEDVCSLTINDVDNVHMTINFNGTNRTDPREVLIPNDLNNLIKEYIENHRDFYFRSKAENPNSLLNASKTTLEDIRAARINSLLNSVDSVWAIAEFLGIHDLTRLRRYISGNNRNIKDDMELIRNTGVLLPDQETYYLQSFFKRKYDRYLKKI